MKKILLILFGVLIVALIWRFVFPVRSFKEFQFNYSPHKRHIYDEAGILSGYNTKKFEEYLDFIFNEYDIDIRFVFMKDIEENTIENVAIEKMQELGIGKDNREERGVLLLYDIGIKKLRVEVGYGLEEYFTDAFVSYLVHFHIKDFFESDDITTGLRLLLFILHHRIRSEVLGNSFDPTILELIQHKGYLSGGAGVSAVMPQGGKNIISSQLNASDNRLKKYLPQATPEDTYQKYLEWLFAQEYDYYKQDIFTTASQSYMAKLPMSKAYFHYILIQEYGRKYAVDLRGDVALLYFTNDPLVSPHFFIKCDQGWQMDIAAEVRNTRNRVGGIYTWDYSGINDVYTKTFLDRLVNIKNYIRIKGGDNRELTIRRNVNIRK